MGHGGKGTVRYNLNSRATYHSIFKSIMVIITNKQAQLFFLFLVHKSRLGGDSYDRRSSTFLCHDAENVVCGGCGKIMYVHIRYTNACPSKISSHSLQF